MRTRTWTAGCLAGCAVLSVLGVLSGCAERGQGLFRGDPAPQIEEYPVLYQKAGKYCGAKREMHLVVRDQAHMSFVPVSDVPVDFNSQMVLFVTLGEVYSQAYDVRIDRVWRQDRLIRVGITRSYPPVGEMGYPHASSPYSLVVVPRSDLNVEGFSAEVALPKMEGASGPLPAAKSKTDRMR